MSQPDLDRCWDVVVLGAGPAGALAARQAALGGLRVLLVERRTFPRAKVCGACLNGKALGVLEAVGLGDLVARLGGLVLDRFALHLEGRAATFALPAGRALGREGLDTALAAAAEAAGATFLPGVAARVEPADRAESRTVWLTGPNLEQAVAARVVVAATGLAGHGLEREAAIRTRIAPTARIGAGCALAAGSTGLEEGTIFMAVGRAGYVGLVRLPGDVLNVAAALDRAALRAGDGPADVAASILAEAGFPRVPGLDRAAWHGTVPLTRSCRPVAAHRLFLIGDAAGYVEPFTGEGMGAALLAARLVSPLVDRAARGWTPALAREWGRLHQRRIARPQVVIRGLAAAARWRWGARLALGLATRSPWATRRVIERINRSPVLLEASR